MLIYAISEVKRKGEYVSIHYIEKFGIVKNNYGFGDVYELWLKTPAGWNSIAFREIKEHALFYGFYNKDSVLLMVNDLINESKFLNLLDNKYIAINKRVFFKDRVITPDKIEIIEIPDRNSREFKNEKEDFFDDFINTDSYNNPSTSSEIVSSDSFSKLHYVERYNKNNVVSYELFVRIDSVLVFIAEYGSREEMNKIITDFANHKIDLDIKREGSRIYAKFILREPILKDIILKDYRK